MKIAIRRKAKAPAGFEEEYRSCLRELLPGEANRHWAGRMNLAVERSASKEPCGDGFVAPSSGTCFGSRCRK